MMCPALFQGHLATEARALLGQSIYDQIWLNPKEIADSYITKDATKCVIEEIISSMIGKRPRSCVQEEGADGYYG